MNISALIFNKPSQAIHSPSNTGIPFAASPAWALCLSSPSPNLHHNDAFNNKEIKNLGWRRLQKSSDLNQWLRVWASFLGSACQQFLSQLFPPLDPCCYRALALYNLGLFLLFCKLGHNCQLFAHENTFMADAGADSSSFYFGTWIN